MVQDFVKCRYKILCYICAAVGSIMLFAVSYFRVLESMPMYSFIFLLLFDRYHISNDVTVYQK